MKDIKEYIVNEAKVDMKHVAAELSDVWYRYLNNSNGAADIIFNTFIEDLFNEVSWAGLESDTEAFKIIAKMAEKLSK